MKTESTGNQLIHKTESEEIYRQSHLFGVPVGFKSNLLLSEASLC